MPLFSLIFKEAIQTPTVKEGRQTARDDIEEGLEEYQEEIKEHVKDKAKKFTAPIVRPKPAPSSKPPGEKVKEKADKHNEKIVPESSDEDKKLTKIEQSQKKEEEAKAEKKKVQLEKAKAEKEFAQKEQEVEEQEKAHAEELAKKDHEIAKHKRELAKKVKEEKARKSKEKVKARKEQRSKSDTRGQELAELGQTYKEILDGKADDKAKARLKNLREKYKDDGAEEILQKIKERFKRDKEKAKEPEKAEKAKAEKLKQVVLHKLRDGLKSTDGKMSVADKEEFKALAKKYPKELQLALQLHKIETTPKSSKGADAVKENASLRKAMIRMAARKPFSKDDWESVSSMIEGNPRLAKRFFKVAEKKLLAKWGKDKSKWPTKLSDKGEEAIAEQLRGMRSHFRAYDSEEAEIEHLSSKEARRTGFTYKQILRFRELAEKHPDLVKKHLAKAQRKFKPGQDAEGEGGEEVETKPKKHKEKDKAPKEETHEEGSEEGGEEEVEELLEMTKELKPDNFKHDAAKAPEFPGLTKEMDKKWWSKLFALHKKVQKGKLSKAAKEELDDHGYKNITKHLDSWNEVFSKAKKDKTLNELVVKEDGEGKEQKQEKPKKPKVTFEDFIEHKQRGGKKPFKNTETGNMVVFDSLPKKDQDKVRTQYERAYPDSARTAEVIASELFGAFGPVQRLSVLEQAINSYHALEEIDLEQAIDFGTQVGFCLNAEQVARETPAYFQSAVESMRYGRFVEGLNDFMKLAGREPIFKGE